MRKFVLSLLVALVLTHQANAQTPSESSINGNDLMTTCAAATTNAYCLGYLIGVLDGIVYVESSLPTKNICLGGKVLRQQIIDVVVNYLKAPPESWHYGAADLIFTALSEKFPCR